MGWGGDGVGWGGVGWGGVANILSPHPNPLPICHKQLNSFITTTFGTAKTGPISEAVLLLTIKL